MQTILRCWILLSCWTCFWMHLCLVCMCALFPKKEKQLAITATTLEINTCIHRVHCPKANIYSFVWNPQIRTVSPGETSWITPSEAQGTESCNEQSHNSPLLSSPLLSSPLLFFLILSLWICGEHEIAIPVYSVAFSGWKSQRNHLPQHSQEMEDLSVWVSCAHLLLLN